MRDDISVVQKSPSVIYNSKNDWMNYAHLMVLSQEQDSTNVSFGDSTS